jgi:hypothetical protein
MATDTRTDQDCIDCETATEDCACGELPDDVDCFGCFDGGPVNGGF